MGAWEWVVRGLWSFWKSLPGNRILTRLYNRGEFCGGAEVGQRRWPDKLDKIAG